MHYAPNCTRAGSLPAGASYQAITATVGVAATAASPQINGVLVSGGGLASAAAYDPTGISAARCDVTGNGVVDSGDVQALINQALGNAPPGNLAAGVAGVQTVVNAALSLGCTI